MSRSRRSHQTRSPTRPPAPASEQPHLQHLPSLLDSSCPESPLASWLGRPDHARAAGAASSKLAACLLRLLLGPWLRWRHGGWRAARCARRVKFGKSGKERFLILVGAGGGGERETHLYPHTAQPVKILDPVYLSRSRTKVRYSTGPRQPRFPHTEGFRAPLTVQSRRT